MELTKDQKIALYHNMCRARKFEEANAKNFNHGNVQGFVHVGIGEEAVGAGLCPHISDDDYLSITHRGHGLAVIRGLEAGRVMAELFGRADGYNKGKGGSMHLASMEHNMLGCNGILGAGAAIASGAALAAKLKKEKRVSVYLLGDGQTNEGIIHECLNAAAVYELPILYVCINNEYGMFTRREETMTVKNVADRCAAYGIEAETTNGMDVLDVYDACEKAVDYVRNTGKPYFLELKTFRPGGHFVGDPQAYRSDDEKDKKLIEQNDPVKRFKAYLLENEIATAEELKAKEREAKEEIDAAVEFALASPFPELSTALEDVYTDMVEEGR